jgi:spermidine/putrescine transport system permease protein
VFAFLLSWGNFPLSLFTTGADQTVPEWLYAKMVSGYTPMVPTLGSLTIGGAVLVVFGVYLALMLRKWLQGRNSAATEVVE